jgi:hypothetical protein
MSDRKRTVDRLLAELLEACGDTIKVNAHGTIMGALADAYDAGSQLSLPIVMTREPRAPYGEGWARGFQRALEMLASHYATRIGNEARDAIADLLRQVVEPEPDPRVRLEAIERALEPLRQEIVEAAWCDTEWEAVAEAAWPGSVAEEPASKEVG